MTDSALADIRRANLRRLGAMYGSLAEINERLGKRRGDPGLYGAACGAKLKSGTPRSIGPQLCKEIERVLELPLGWMSTPHDDTAAQPDQSQSSLGLFDFATNGGMPVTPPAAQAQSAPAPAPAITIPALEENGAATGSILFAPDDFAAAFPGRAADDFKAWIVSGDDMAPRFLAGDRVLVDVTARAPAPGYFILAISGRRVLRKLSTALTGELVLSAEKNPSASLPLAEGMEIIGRAVYLVRAARL